MSILFEESKPKGAPKKAIGKVSSGLSSRAKNPFGAGSMLGIFDNVAPKGTQQPTRTQSGQIVRDTKKGQTKNAVIEYMERHAELKRYVFVLPISDLDLSHRDRHKVALESALAAQLSLEGPNRARDELQVSYAAEHARLQRETVMSRPKAFDVFAKKALMSLINRLSEKIVKRLYSSLDTYTDFVMRVGELVHNVQVNGDFDMMIKLSAAEIEDDLRSFAESDNVIKQLKERITRVKSAMTLVRQPKVEFTSLISLARRDFNERTGYFSDRGEVERMMWELVERDEDRELSDRVVQAETNPGLIGQLTLATSRDFLKSKTDKGDVELQIVFILFARYFFASMLERAPRLSVSSQFEMRVVELRKLSPMELSINESFLPSRYLAVPIRDIPFDNPYRESVEMLLVSAFQYCPIDFCNVIYDAIKSIQTIASKMSYDARVAVGRLEAKSDHLLCLDDLSDILLIVFLISEPYAIAPLVERFAPFVPGLEMTAELEFAFTNISAIVAHILELDFDKFVKEAKQKTKSAIEIDPLNILG